jgi:hypothetical protein
MSVQMETLVAGLVTAWQASASLTAAVPGGIWFGQAPQTLDGTVYATLSVSMESIEETATRDYVQFCRIEAAIYSAAAMTAASWATIRTAINSAWVQGTVTVSGATVISLNPASASVELMPDRLNSEDVLVGKAAFTAMFQGTF